jgi:hypothetical protein
MSAKLACPHCKAPLAADPEMAGLSVPCYLCHTSFEVQVDPGDFTTSKVHRPSTVIDIIENYLSGNLFDVEAADRLGDVPLDHLQPLFESLNQYYRDWLENHVEARWGITDSSEYHLFVPYPPDYPADHHLQQCKKMLLYLPNMTWHDPLADALLPVFLLWDLGVGVNEDKLRADLRAGLHSVALLAPLIRNGDVTLIPQAAVLSYNLLQQRAQEELQRVSSDKDDLLTSAGKVWGHFCSMTRYTPVACDPFIHRFLTGEYEAGRTGISHVPQITHRVATSLFRYELPGVNALPLDELIYLRCNVPAFQEWRLGVESFLEQVRKEEPEDSEQERVELRHAGEAILRPKVESLNKEIKGSSALEKIFLPGFIAASSAMVTYHLTGSLPVSTIVSGGVTSGSWIIDKVLHQFRRKPAKAAAVREVYNSLLDIE